MAIHRLKTQLAFFEEVNSGKKTFELRKNDRQFSTGDILVLEEYNAHNQLYTGRRCQMEVTYILNSIPEFGLMDGFCIMGIRKYNSEYYYLKNGEIVQEGDECEVSNSIHDPAKWVPAGRTVGTAAPDPLYPAHRKYRRLISE